MTAETADTTTARRHLPLGLLLWLGAVAVFVLSVVFGLVIALVDTSSSTSALAVIFIPLIASVLYAPLTIAALVVSIVGVRRPGPASGLQRAGLIGSAITVLPSVGILALTLFAYSGEIFRNY